MAAKKPPHVVVTELSSEDLRQLLVEVAYVRTQDPVFLNIYITWFGERVDPEAVRPLNHFDGLKCPRLEALL